MSGRHRAEELPTLLKDADILEADTDLDEARALVEFARYEDNRGLETYRLVQGVALLEVALDSYSGDDGAETALNALLLTEYANLYLTGDEMPRGRMTYLDKLIGRARITLSRTDLDPLAESQYCVALAQALKEKAMVTHEMREHRTLYMEARSLCDRASALASTDDDIPSTRVAAQARRHVAITYEMEADKTSAPRLKRQHIEQWHQNSDAAVPLAQQAGDDFLQAYALMNVASSHTRLALLDQTTSQKRDRLDLGKDHLAESLRLLEAVSDARGQGWVHIHLCENTELRAQLEIGDSQVRVMLLRELEHYANRALAHLKQLNDELGLALAYLQLGKALYMLHAASGHDSATHVRLSRATAVCETETWPEGSCVVGLKVV